MVYRIIYLNNHLSRTIRGKYFAASFVNKCFQVSIKKYEYSLGILFQQVQTISEEIPSLLLSRKY